MKKRGLAVIWKAVRAMDTALMAGRAGVWTQLSLIPNPILWTSILCLCSNFCFFLECPFSLSLPVKTLPCLQHHNTLHLGLSHSDNNNWYSSFIWEAWKCTSQGSFARNLTGPGVLIPWVAVHILWEAQIKEGLSRAKWGLGISWISKTLFEKTYFRALSCISSIRIFGSRQRNFQQILPDNSDI